MTASETNGIKRHLWGVAATVVAGLLLQTGTMFYWAGQLTARVKHVEDGLSRCESRVHRLEITP